MLSEQVISSMKWDDHGLIPAIVQDAQTRQVLMLAYMNKESLQATLTSGYATFWSRSRQSIWRKGETSGHGMPVQSIAVDCDADTLLLFVNPEGAACHTGQVSCFYRSLSDFANNPIRE